MCDSDAFDRMNTRMEKLEAILKKLVIGSNSYVNFASCAIY